MVMDASQKAKVEEYINNNEQGRWYWKLADTVADLDNINVNNYAAGSTCLVVATKDVYILNTQKEWAVL